MLMLGLALALLAQSERPAGVPADAELIGPPRSDGTILYDEPSAFEEVALASVPIVADTVVAAQRVEIPLARRVSDRRIATGAPFRVDLPAGSYFAVFRGPQGPRRCFQPMPMTPFTPPEDERGEIFPGRCLVDNDGDGAFETLRMIPYLRRNSPRDVAIEPVQLGPAPGADDPREPRLRLYRRIRIAQATETGLLLVVEHAGRARRDDALDYRDGGAVDRTQLPLREGATATIAGITLEVRRDDGGWRLIRSGAFEPWVRLESEGTAVRAGPFYIPPRED